MTSEIWLYLTRFFFVVISLVYPESRKSSKVVSFGTSRGRMWGRPNAQKRPKWDVPVPTG